MAQASAKLKTDFTFMVIVLDFLKINRVIKRALYDAVQLRSKRQAPTTSAHLWMAQEWLASRERDYRQ